jgi:hypothetical protein
MSDALFHWRAGGWAVGTILIWFGLAFGSLFFVGRWLRRLWLRRKELGFGKRTLAVVVGAVTLLGVLGTLAGLVKAFAAVGADGVDASQKARLLAEGIAEAMNCTAFGILLGTPSVLALALLTRGRSSPTNNR